MSAVFTLNNLVGNGTDNTQNQFIYDGTVALTGNYGGSSTHGDTLDLSTIPTLKANVKPLFLRVEFLEASPAGAAGSFNRFIYTPAANNNLATGKLQIITAGGSEYTQNSAYGTPPFGITGFVLQCRVWLLSYL